MSSMSASTSLAIPSRSSPPAPPNVRNPDAPSTALARGPPPPLRFTSRGRIGARCGMKLKQFLSRLLHEISAAEYVSLELADREIAGVTSDSRSVKPGYLFVAIPGTKLDGLAFVEEAVASGALAVIAERSTPKPLPRGIAFIKVTNARRALALASAQFYPRQPAVIAAVTGTSGKTSVAAFTRQIWTALGEPAASKIGRASCRERV